MVCGRLRSHLISFDLLSKAQYGNLKDEAFKEKLTRDFNVFLRDRAQLVVIAMKALTQGEEPTVDSVWATHAQEAPETLNGQGA